MMKYPLFEADFHKQLRNAINKYLLFFAVIHFVTSAIQSSHMTHQVFINMALMNLACCYDALNRNITKDIYDS